MPELKTQASTYSATNTTNTKMGDIGLKGDIGFAKRREPLIALPNGTVRAANGTVGAANRRALAHETAKKPSALAGWMNIPRNTPSVGSLASTALPQVTANRPKTATNVKPAPTLIAPPQTKKDASMISSNIPPTTRNATIIAASSNIPHPDKKDKGGEDAFVIRHCNGAFLMAVLDGVGGWAKVGVDPAAYARTLAMRIGSEFCAWAEVSFTPRGQRIEGVAEKTHLDKPLFSILRRAFDYVQTTNLPGSCTVCVSMLLPSGEFHVLNLGDSGLRIIRNGKVVLATEEQQHSFNFPKQLGMKSPDMPEDGDYVVVKNLKAGDLMVSASDGTWDNLWEGELVALSAQSTEAEPVASDRDNRKKMMEGVGQLASKIAQASHARGLDKLSDSPFAKHARAAGIASCTGGKLDDVTVLVARVC
eukprot:CAMPEP_0181306896 /NCGR_PEP_ID=MMETSP1101-20121128/10561_1 /TAXON_ID=46948 /ORGANISM="Rhodomonas abbreviata, Strain Caron Lab Isolate" /LENGTH=419 /DNA_ID=CAMNT_0023413017 /DNA_START=36 /DNA_END=1295 /DNA_ORIENTATION=+